MIKVWVCPHCGHRVEETTVKLWPGGQAGRSYYCKSHGMLFQWQLWGEAEWLEKRLPQLRAEQTKKASLHV